MAMCWPGIAAVAVGTAGLEGELAPSVRAAGHGPVVEQPEGTALPGPGSIALPVVRRTRHVPCMDDPDLFFAESPEDVESAKALCRGCPAQRQCLTGARERREPWGVWGGELFLRGEVIPRKRPRGRPRKTEVAA